ncbi:imidazolonepropionase [Lutimonas saemankumensis]|uniref:imidazolonepropionase n=1 Tax=Lutimonas saemankumensis TaxID=483016 RepID=UPI001CD4837A|nr:imidazolonepropionase [Lutimonas saemankumensis]MCA0931127.1 imidazolonepropionase [Lutimonas saemankumensis]
MKTLFFNIKELVQIRDSSTLKVQGEEMKKLPTIKNAFLVVEDEKITDFGSMSDLQNFNADQVIDSRGQMILPAWCDSHTHIVYAGNRESEFVDRINGLSYEEIASKGGGILNSAKKLEESSEQELFEQASQRIKEVMRLGTGAIEIKSGYGLSLESELKMLKVIKMLKDTFAMDIKATFLGAHAFPNQFKENKNAYVDLICDQMIPEVASQNLADFIDVFCEVGYFDVVQTEKILKAGKAYNMIPKIHVNQFNSIGGIEVGVKCKALSVDHLEVMNEDDFEILKGSEVMPVALPSCSYFLSIPYTPARKIIDEGLPLALATDFNPGSTPSGNMNFVVSTACIKMKITPEEAINAATINGAYAMGLSNSSGSITKGKDANLIIYKDIPSLNFIPYAFGSNLIDKVMIKGSFI